MGYYDFPIKTDEILTGFISRFSRSKGLRLRDLCSHMAIRVSRLSSDPEMMGRLAAATGVPVPLLKARDVNSKKNMLLGEKMPSKGIWTRSPRFCPRCLVADLDHRAGRQDARPYLRAPWVASNLSVCPEHAVEFATLPDYLPGQQGDFSGALSAKIGTIRRLADEAVSISVTESDKYFHDRLAGRGQPTPMLGDLPYGVALALTEVVGAMELFGDEVKMGGLDFKQLSEARACGFATTSKGYEELSAFLSARDEAFRQRDNRKSGHHLYGSLYALLRNRNPNRDYATITELVRDHAMLHHPFGKDETFLGKTGQRRWHSVRTASQEYGIHEKLLRKILLDQGLISPEQSDRTDGATTFPAEDFDALLPTIQDSVTAGWTMSKLGITREPLKQLVARKILKGTMGITLGGGMRIQYSRREVLSVCNAILDVAELPVSSTSLVPLVLATKLARCTYAEIVELFLSRSLETVFRTGPTDCTLGSLLVDAEEVKTKTTLAEVQGIDLRRLEGILKTTSRTIKMLVDRRLIRSFTAPNPQTRREQTYVAREAIELFQASYVSLHELSQTRGQIAKIRKILTERGVLPVTLPADPTTYYLRSEVTF